MPAGPNPLATHDAQLALLSEVARIATADLELRPMLQRVTDLLHQRIGWEFVSLATLDFERGEISCEALSTTMQTPLEVGQRWPLGTGVVGAVASSGNTRSYADVRQSDTYVGVNPGTMSELCVPVRHRGGVVAVLNLESRRIGAFDGQQGFVETVAEQVAGPIAGAHLYEEMRQRAAFTEVMAEVSRIALDPAPLDELLHRIVEYIADSFAMPVAAIYLLDEDGARFVREVHHGTAAKPLPEEKWSVAHGVAGRCVRLGRPVLVGDVAQDPDYIPAGDGVRSEFVVPIRYRQQQLGVLNLESTRLDAFPPFAQRAFVGVADQIAGAIYGARAREQQREHALLMELLSDLSRLATRDAPLPEVLRGITDHLAEHFGVAAASILLLDDDGQHFSIETMSGELKLGSPTPGGWPITVGVCGRAARTGQPQLAYAGIDPDYIPGHPSIQSEYVTPIKLGNRVLGVLNLESFGRGTFTEQVVIVLDAIADQLAGAINMALLNRRLQETNRMVELRTSELGTVNQKLAQANLELRRLSMHDPLTDIPNRRRFDEVLRHEWRWGARTHKPIAVLLMDLDHFKLLNDTHGHPYGDDCLRKVGRAFTSALTRAADFVARYGGEEFGVILPDSDLESARRQAEALRAAVAALNLRHDGAPKGRLTLSIGVAVAVPDLDQPPAEIVARADAALYAAKAAGRDRVEQAPG
jgi:diguanylate cyclase (GGDEF)-like protein